MTFTGEFAIRDCSLVTMATGVQAQNLREFAAGLNTVPVDCIYHHFWGRFLRSQFDEPEYNNDFAAWAWHALHDRALAEKLSMVNPADFPNFEKVREELIDIVENRLDEGELVPWAKADQRFHFLRSQVIAFDAGLVCKTPAQLLEVLPKLANGSIYYHFIDARRRTPDHADDFSCWLMNLDPAWHPLAQALRDIDPYFSSLHELRRDITMTFVKHIQQRAL